MQHVVTVKLRYVGRQCLAGRMREAMTTPDASYTFRDNPMLLLLPAGIFAAVGACFLVIGVGEVGRGALLPALGAFPPAGSPAGWKRSEGRRRLPWPVR